jgi:TonB family protein
MVSRLLLLGVALGAAAIPCGYAQDKPGKTPPALPGQKAHDANSAPEAAPVGVETVTPIPPADRDNLKSYWLAVGMRTGQRWQRTAAAKTAGSGAVTVTGWIHTDGRVTGLALEHRSGKASVDRAAMEAIAGSAPYDAFPYGIAVEQVKVRFSFGTFAAPPGTPGAEPVRPVH